MTDKQTINITLGDLINGNLRDMEFTAQFGVYRQAVKELYAQNVRFKQTLTEIKQLLEDALDTDKTDTEQSFENFYKALEKCEVKNE